jgi:hypothetical protein
MEPGLMIDYVWSDEDVVEIELSGSNGAFAGQMQAYVAPGELAKIAESLSGFPRDHTDTREVSFGSTAMTAAGGAASLHFYCTDRTGTAFIDLSIAADPVSFDGGQHVRIALPIESQAVDLFVTQLRSLEKSKKAALLVGSPRNWRRGTSSPVLKSVASKEL